LKAESPPESLQVGAFRLCWGLDILKLTKTLIYTLQ